MTPTRSQRFKLFSKCPGKQKKKKTWQLTKTQRLPGYKFEDLRRSEMAE